jgi:hypothetical protein
VFGNVGTMITFRVGAFDAEVLEKEFAPQFMATDLVNLGFTQIYLKLMINGVSSQPFSASTLGPIPKPDVSYRDAIIGYSRADYAQPRAKVEEDIVRWHQEGRESHGSGSKDGGKDGKRFDGPRPGPSGQGGYGGERRAAPSGGVSRDAAPRDAAPRPYVPPRPAEAPRQATPASSSYVPPPQTQQAPRPASAPSSAPQRPYEQRPRPSMSQTPPPQKVVSSVKQEEQERRELELRQAISLSTLKRTEDKERDKKKVMTPENAQALRSLLGSVLGTELPEIVVPPAPVVAPQPAAAAAPAPQPAQQEQRVESRPEPRQQVQPQSQPQPQPQAPRPQQPPQAQQARPERPKQHDPAEIPLDVLEATLRLDDEPPKV